MSNLYRKVKGWAIIDVSREINYETSLNLKNQIEEISYAGIYNIAINLKDVSFIGSLSLGIFSFGKKLLSEKGGDICILHPNSVVKEALSTTQIEKIVRIVNSEDEL